MNQSTISQDITELILDDHATFRRLFARLDEANTGEDDRRIWNQLGPLLEAHAVAEEQTLYPALLKAARDDDSVKDMIHDHNEIRDAVHAADQCEAGSEAWRKHVGDARNANSDHMAEEERETLAAARKHLSRERRVELGDTFTRLRNAFPSDGLGAMDRDKDPSTYVRDHA